MVISIITFGACGSVQHQTQIVTVNVTLDIIFILNKLVRQALTVLHAVRPLPQEALGFISFSGDDSTYLACVQELYTIINSGDFSHLLSSAKYR